VKKIVLLIALGCLLKLSASCQLSFTLQVPQSGVLLKSQLWNAVIVNSYPDTRQVYLGLSLSDAITGNPVVTALTGQFTVPQGATQISETNVSPIIYSYLSNDIIDRDPEGYLPAGSYTACYTLFLTQEGIGSFVAEQCTPLIVEPVSPPILNTPFNQQKINTSFPQFTWIPPFPLEIFSNLTYDFILVEVGEGQNAADAIQQNLPVYSENFSDVFLNYPASAISLDTNKVYAWQVKAKNNGQFTAQSEVWTFSLSDTTTNVPEDNFSTYTKLKRYLDASISVSVKNILAYYENNADDSTATYSIYDIDQNSENDGSLKFVKSGTIRLSQGINLINLTPEELQDLEDGKEYLFQVYNSRNETWSMKFFYYRNTKKDKNN
jgi:hypothetical protein